MAMWPRNGFSMGPTLTLIFLLPTKEGAFLPSAGIALEMLRAVKNQGKGELDSCSVMTIIENPSTRQPKMR